MDIREIDSNLIQETKEDLSDIELYDASKAPFSLHGIQYDEEEGRFCRFDHTTVDIGKKGIHYVAGETAGGRIRFSTDSTEIVLIVEYPYVTFLTNMPRTGTCGFALNKNVGDQEQLVINMRPEQNDEKGFVRTVKFANPENKMQDFTLYLPLYNLVNKVYIGVTKGAKVGKGKSYRQDVKPIMYYGSSITQGGCASRPDTCYQGLICKKNNVDFINYGMSGWARAEENMVKFLAKTDCSVAVLDYDHNAPSPEYLKETHLRMYRIYREARPDTPIILISRPDHLRDDVVNKRYRIIKKTYNIAKKEGDKNIYFIDGRTFFGMDEFDICTSDCTHPTDLGFYKMAQKIGKLIDSIILKDNK